MNLLAIDTTTQTGSIALLEEEKIISEKILDLQVTQVEKLLPAVALLFRETGWDFERLEGLAVSIGPGSFTGLRIGLATMKAFAQVHNLPLIGVSSLEALAHNAHESKKPVAAVLDAKRKEVYAAVYQFSDGHIDKILLKEQAIAPDLLCNTLKKFGPPLIVGHGGKEMQIRAGWVGRLALDRLKRGEGRDWRRLTPNYLRPSDAKVGVGPLWQGGGGRGPTPEIK